MAGQLNFEIRNQLIKRVDKFIPMSKSRNYLVAHFDFKTGEWSHVPLKTAIFEMENGTAYKTIISEDGDCMVPWETIDTTGFIYVSVFGGDRITTGKARVRIAQSGYIEDAENETEPTQDIYDQLIDELNEIKDGNLDGGLFTDWDKET